MRLKAFLAFFPQIVSRRSAGFFMLMAFFLGTPAARGRTIACNYSFSTMIAAATSRSSDTSRL